MFRSELERYLRRHSNKQDHAEAVNKTREREKVIDRLALDKSLRWIAFSKRFYKTVLTAIFSMAWWLCSLCLILLHVVIVALFSKKPSKER